MPYGDLLAERVQRFGSMDDLDRADVTIEEREEYEQHIAEGTPVFVGVDYAAILEAAEAECDILLFDGGNNDLPFYRPTVHIVVADPLRSGDEATYHPGETNVRMADAVVINKSNVAHLADVFDLETSIRGLNRTATIVRAASELDVDDEDAISGKRVLVVEDGPTLTHGGMKYGAGVIAAQQYGAARSSTLVPTLKARSQRCSTGTTSGRCCRRRGTRPNSGTSSSGRSMPRRRIWS